MKLILQNSLNLFAEEIREINKVDADMKAADRETDKKKDLSYRVDAYYSVGGRYWKIMDKANKKIAEIQKEIKDFKKFADNIKDRYEFD